MGGLHAGLGDPRGPRLVNGTGLQYNSGYEDIAWGPFGGGCTGDLDDAGVRRRRRGRAHSDAHPDAHGNPNSDADTHAHTDAKPDTHAVGVDQHAGHLTAR